MLYLKQMLARSAYAESVLSNPLATPPLPNLIDES